MFVLQQRAVSEVERPAHLPLSSAYIRAFLHLSHWCGECLTPHTNNVFSCCADSWSVWHAGNIIGLGLCGLAFRYWLLTSFGFSPFQDDLELLFSVYTAWYPQSPAASQISLQNKATENEQKTAFRPNYPLPSFFSRCMKDLIYRLLMLFQNAVLTTAFLLFSFSVCRTIRTIMWFVVLNCPILKTSKVSFDLAIEYTWETFELGILSCDRLIY